MDKLFNPDNPVMIFLGRCFDLILLNVCFVLSCLPVFTIGPALTALFKITLDMADGEWGYIASRYIASFKENFKQAVSLWLLFLGVTAFLCADLYVVFFRLPEGFSLLQFPLWVILFLDISVLIFAFPLMSRYQETNKELIKNSILLSIGNIPFTIFVAVIFGILSDIALHNGGLMVLFFSVFLFIGCALSARILSIFLKRIFLKAGRTNTKKEEADKK